MNFCSLDNVKISSFNPGKHMCMYRYMYIYYMYVCIYVCVYKYICDYMYICGYIYLCVYVCIYMFVTASCNFAKVDHKSFSCINFLVFLIGQACNHSL